MALTAVRTSEPEVPQSAPHRPSVTPASSPDRRARRALLVLLLLLVVAQPLSIPLAYYAIARFIGVVPAFVGMDVHTQWEAYMARPQAPEVLFIGDSQTYTDIDTAGVARALTAKLGRPITVAKFGVPGEGPAFLEGLMYRVMHRESRPRLIVYELQEYVFNANRRWDPTADLWELSNPPDPGFLQLAFRVDPQRSRLLRSWLVPYFMTYQPISQLAQCSVFELAQAGAMLLGRVPVELRHEAACKSGEAYLQVNRYVDDPSFRFSDREATYVSEAVAMARAGGTEVAFGQYPFVGLEAINPTAYQTFRARVDQLAGELQVPTFSLVTELTDDQSIHDRSLWLDLAHMEPGGARALAPRVAQEVTGFLHW
jgi:hypothetical protein